MISGFQGFLMLVGAITLVLLIMRGLLSLISEDPEERFKP